MLAGVVVGAFVAILNGQWKDFRTALLATALTLGCFAAWHLIRVPFLLHRDAVAANEFSEPGFLAGAFGILVIAGMLIGGYELALSLWAIHPLGEIKSTFSSAGGPALNIPNIQLKREIQSKLSLFMTKGEAIRDAWKAAMGKPGESQLPHANKARQWHTALEDYLRKIPRGDIYVARLNSAPRAGFGGYPMGHDPKVNDTWDLLISDLAVLEQFMKDPELGEP